MIFHCAAFVWSQEEHRNMGAWTFVRPRFENLIGQQVKILAATGGHRKSSRHFPQPTHIFPFRLSAACPQLHYCGRCEAPTPATGIGKVHKREVDEIVAAPFEL